MVYFILITLIIIFGLILWGLVVLINNHPRKTLSVITIISASIFGLYHYAVYQFHLSFLPNSMHVWKQLYASEESWGFGPGGNETGLIEFEIPNNISENVEKEGVAYLKQLGNSGKCSSEWQETPITTNSESWFKNADGQDSTSPDIANYLYRYGFYIPIDQHIISAVNQSISESGSYLSYCEGGGVLIVMPKTHKIIFAYSG